MKIVDLVTETFHYRSRHVRDSEGHGHPGPEHDARQTLLRIVTDEVIGGLESHRYQVTVVADALTLTSVQDATCVTGGRLNPQILERAFP